jgi:hypothetical protein
MKSVNQKAFSIIEYVVLIVIIIGAFLVMRNLIQRGIFGMWQQAGQGFAFGRQYDPQRSVDCVFDDLSNKWYDRNCFEQAIGNANPPCSSGGSSCEENAIQGCIGQGSECDNVTATDPT